MTGKIVVRTLLNASRVNLSPLSYGPRAGFGPKSRVPYLDVAWRDVAQLRMC